MKLVSCEMENIFGGFKLGNERTIRIESRSFVCEWTTMRKRKWFHFLLSLSLVLYYWGGSDGGTIYEQGGERRKKLAVLLLCVLFVAFVHLQKPFISSIHSQSISSIYMQTWGSSTNNYFYLVQINFEQKLNSVAVLLLYVEWVSRVSA